MPTRTESPDDEPKTDPPPDKSRPLKADAKGQAAKSEPRTPPPPTIPAPPTIKPRVQGTPMVAPRRSPTIKVEGRTFDDDDRSEAGTESAGSRPTAPPATAKPKPTRPASAAKPMPSLAAGPVTLRPATSRAPGTDPDDDAVDPSVGEGASSSEPSANEERDAADAPPASDGPQADEAEGAEAGARLPMPGMLRDDAPLEVKEFRGKARKGPPPPPTAGVLPTAGITPPSTASGAPVAVTGADTDVLIAEVALEMIGDERLGAPKVSDEDGTELGAAASPKAAASSKAAATAAADVADGPEGEATESPLLLATPPDAPTTAQAAPVAGIATRPRVAVAAVLLLGGLWWALGGGDPPIPDVPPNAVAAKAPGTVAPRPPREADPQSTAVGADAHATSNLAAEAGTGGGETQGAESEGSAADGLGSAGATHGTDSGGTDSGGAGSGGAGSGGAGSGGTDSGGTDSATSEGSGGSGGEEPSAEARKPSSKPKPRRTPKKPTPATPAPTPTAAAPNAAQLLSDARRAYSAGRSGEAYKLAKQSNGLKRSTSALETMALASCQRKDESTARGLLKKLPLSRRSSVRDRCRTYGVRLGL